MHPNGEMVFIKWNIVFRIGLVFHVHALILNSYV